MEVGLTGPVVPAAQDALTAQSSVPVAAQILPHHVEERLVRGHLLNPSSAAIPGTSWPGMKRLAIQVCNRPSQGIQPDAQSEADAAATGKAHLRVALLPTHNTGVPASARAIDSSAEKDLWPGRLKPFREPLEFL